MNIKLQHIPFPAEEFPETAPIFPVTEYTERINALYSRAGMDWVVVYGDREHFANLTFLTGYDPRFEEALLLIGPGGRRFLVVGNEGRGYAPLTTPWIEVLLCQSFSLGGQPRATAPRLADVLAASGIGAGMSIGVVGWKYLDVTETDDPRRPAFVPVFIVHALRHMVGSHNGVSDVTALMMNPADGLRACNSAAQIAAFEWSAMRASTHVFRILRGTHPGMSEFAAVAQMGYEGDPLTAHVMFASGSGNIVGLRSPTARRIEAGDGVTTAVSFWGSLVCRAGMISEPDDAFFATYCVPYFRAMATWYQALHVGALGGDIFTAVTAAFGDAPFNSMLNPGHLVSFDEWVHSPIRPNSADRIASGMALQSDIIPYPLPAGLSLNCEDTVVIADAALRADLQAGYPALWSRIQARCAFMTDQLGITLAEEVLPLSIAPAYLPPFWGQPERVCALRD